MALPFPLAAEPDPAMAEQGRKLFAGPVDFVKGVVAMSGLPPADRAEVCFAGRSNVGKSSLINALTSRKALARASNTPGRTQEINFFTLGPAHYLVDLPGYGYANAPLAKVEAWQALLKQYLSGRATLRRAFVLVDMRHGIKPVDEEIMALLDPMGQTAIQFDDAVITGDRTATQIILRNLIDNAMKNANGKATFKLRLTIRVETVGAKFLKISVYDNGSGFSDPALAFLNNGKARTDSGFGLLGVRRLIHARGGTILVTNRSSTTGAKIQFSLPGTIAMSHSAVGP